MQGKEKGGEGTEGKERRRDERDERERGGRGGVRGVRGDGEERWTKGLEEEGRVCMESCVY